MAGQQVDRREARRALFRLRRKIEEEADEINFLNIMPMMDMMTILLVFLIKQFSVQQLAVSQPQGLQLPPSTAQRQPLPAVNITITQTAIVIEDDAVVEVQNGTVDPKWKSQGAQGYSIDPIVSALSKHRTRLTRLAKMQGQTFEGIALVMADRRTPYRLLTEVLYSAGRAEFANYRLIVMQKGQ
ncbi:MAG TPA: biopolymer transporter ExbD [Pseudomonadota bacterium]|nr:biopolymer transporter ExbD [Pseudomonadota bacterium]